MISSKKIELLTIALMVLAVGFVLAGMLYPAADTGDGGTVQYADGFSVTYSAEDDTADWQNATAYQITLQGDTATTDSGKVLVDGGNISILGGGTYVLRGELQDGSIIVNATDNATVHLVLNGAAIHSSDYAALYIEQAEAVVLTIADGTENTLTDGTAYDAEKQEDGKPSACIYSRDNLTINGSGTLSVTGNYEDAIKCNDTLKIVGTQLQISAVDDGINANDCAALVDSDITVTAGGDAIHSDGNLAISGGSLTIAASDDAVHAEKTLVLEPAALQITRCREGLEGAYIIINSGEIHITASDDGINAVGEGSSGMEMPMMQQKANISEDEIYLTINGGSIYVESSGDGLDSNGAAALNGGTLRVYGPENNGNSSLDFQYGLLLNGGNLLAAGSSGMAELPSESSAQNSLVFYLNENYAAGSTIQLTDQTGTVLADGTSGKQFNWVCASDAAITQGDSYTLWVNGTAVAQLECTGTITSSGNKTGAGGMGGMGNMGHTGRRAKP